MIYAGSIVHIISVFFYKYFGREKKATDLTYEMLRSGKWEDTEFKEYKFDVLGQEPQVYVYLQRYVISEVSPLMIVFATYVGAHCTL